MEGKEEPVKPKAEQEKDKEEEEEEEEDDEDVAEVEEEVADEPEKQDKSHNAAGIAKISGILFPVALLWSVL